MTNTAKTARLPVANGPRHPDMQSDTWFLFVSVVTAVIVLPGPAACLCASQGAALGVLRSLHTVAGGTLSALVLLSASAVGLGAAMQQVPWLGELLRWSGVGYLVLLSLRQWRCVAHRATDVMAHPATGWQGLRAGFLLGLTNPKDLLFFGALLPPFIDATRPLGWQFATMFATWAAIDGVVMTAYAVLGWRCAGGRAAPGGPRLRRLSAAAMLLSAGLLALQT